MRLKKEKVLPIIMSALEEDMARGDVTSQVVFEKDEIMLADVVSGEDSVLAGLDVAKWIFNVVDERIIFRPLYSDGYRVKKGKKVLSLSGYVRNILTAERTVLNFLGRLSGVATLTREFVDRIKGTKAKIFDTRKTMPGLRILDKYAVCVGGGSNHRMDLWDGILIKDNHIEARSWKSEAGREGAIKDAIKKAREKGYKDIEAEVENLTEFRAALEAGADIIMLDNMKLEDIRKTVKMRNSQGPAARRQLIEASGGVQLDNVSDIAKTGVDRISIGSLTHSAPSIDFSLEIYR